MPRRRTPLPTPSPPPASVTALLGGEDPGGFARATVPRAFRFPDDHGPHPEYRHEWWYFTGNLRTPGGRRFGYQLTFFRFALSPDPPARASRWATNQAYMAHFALTDVEGRRFRPFERVGRGALGLAGATARPLRVWLDDWSAEGAEASTLPIRLRAVEDGASIDLVLDTARPIVPQGDRGLSRKSAAPGNASYYYSMTRLATRGSVRVGGVSFPVEGNSWLDREWGTGSLEKGQTGWDWFALQLADGRDLMFYRLRGGDGLTDPFSAGTLVPRRSADRDPRILEEPGDRCAVSFPLADAAPVRRADAGGRPTHREPGIADLHPVLGRGGRGPWHLPRGDRRGGRVRRVDGVRGNGRTQTLIEGV